jgi:hypothetical protein
VSQLSRWVRPRLQKYNGLFPALQSFRQFCSVALSDPELEVKVKQVIASHLCYHLLCPHLTRSTLSIQQTRLVVRDTRIVPTHLQGQGARLVDSDKGFQREVIVDINSLPSSSMNMGEQVEEGAFIDPALLLSQKSFHRKALGSSFSIRTTSADAASRVVPEYSSESVDSDLSTILSQAVRTSSTQPEGKPPTSTTTAGTDRSNIAHVFTRKDSDTEKVTRVPPTHKSPFYTSENVLSAHLHSSGAQSSTSTAVDLSRGDSSIPPTTRKSVGLSAQDDFSFSQSQTEASSSSAQQRSVPSASSAGGIKKFFSQQGVGVPTEPQRSLSGRASASSDKIEPPSTLSRKDAFKALVG